MEKILLVGIGGFAGSIARYLFSGYTQQFMKSFEFPYGTIAVNLLGCFLMGGLSELADTHGLFSADSRSFLFIGVLGGFTTFSTFGNETMNLLRDGENIPALLNVGAHIFLGLGAVWIGRALAHLIWG